MHYNLFSSNIPLVPLTFSKNYLSKLIPLSKVHKAIEPLMVKKKLIGPNHVEALTLRTILGIFPLHFVVYKFMQTVKASSSRLRRLSVPQQKVTKRLYCPLCKWEGSEQIQREICSPSLSSFILITHCYC